MEVWAVGEGTRRSDYLARPSSSAFFPYSSSPFPYSSSPLLCLFGVAGQTGMFWLLYHLPAPSTGQPWGVLAPTPASWYISL